ncbi:magnesium transporter [Nitrincola tapanii]|uniref:Magnesium transporter MgtE n=1 Tax=Nitrincola tapanii TaxID=1708751 RepID=A0A5A9W4Z5_9GAMM|nr:magnesium transporter [Nitrincola tapanii]KAA0875158.1 magnesium transporter [Nitrincola tapanii]
MSYAMLANTLRSAMEKQDTVAIEELVCEFQPADLAEFLRHEETEVCLKILAHLALAERAEVFGYLPLTLQAEVAEEMTLEGLAQLLSSMESDERADLFNLMEEERQVAVLKLMAHEEREDLRRMASYAEGTVGAIMTSNYASVPERASVAEALDIVRKTAPDAETIYQIYVLDNIQRLVGTLSLRELILNRPSMPISSIMTTELLTTYPDEPQEDASRMISRYDLLALPVIDAQQRLVGIVTYDDAMDVAEQEATEDILKGGTVGNLEGSLREASLFTLYRKRIVWLVLLVFANIFSAAGIALYEETISTYIVLVFFLPLLVGSAGNAGSQASTLMVRGLATGDVLITDWARMFAREFLVALGLGLTMALAVSLIGAVRGGPEIAMVVASSMVAVVMLGSLVGMSLPFLLNKLGWDPATASAPLVATIADAVGVLVYFAIATAILGL